MAMCDFPAIQDDELGFNAGDVIEVLDMSHPFWWKGKLKGIIGLFPVNATRPL